MIITELANAFFGLLNLIIGIPPLSTTNPCTRNNIEANYKNFVHKHVLQTNFDRNSVPAWESYLKDQDLWCRTSTQSFMEASQHVEDICTSGRRVENGGNLCMSQSQMRVYDVITKKNNNGCSIKVTLSPTFVIVACDKIGNRCLPVHYQKYERQKATNVQCLPQEHSQAD